MRRVKEEAWRHWPRRSTGRGRPRPSERAGGFDWASDCLVQRSQSNRGGYSVEDFYHCWGIHSLDFCCDEGSVGPRLVERDAGLQPREHAVIVPVTPALQFVGGEGPRNPKFSGLVIVFGTRQRELEVLLLKVGFPCSPVGPDKPGRSPNCQG